MDERLLCRLKEITDEERAILAGGQGIQRERYTSGRDFVVDSEKMLEKGKLIEIRPHTRFVHFPRHRHNYVEVLYMCNGSTTHILNGTSRMVLHTGDLLFLNQAVYHEILPASEEDVGVNFIILPQFFDRSFRMLEQENVLRDFLISTLSEASTFAGWLHIAAGDILPVENLLESILTPVRECDNIIKRSNETGATLCRSGGIGRRPGLKIPWEQSRAGSTPVSGTTYRGIEQLVARRAHNPEAGGSSPPPATTLCDQKRYRTEKARNHAVSGLFCYENFPQEGRNDAASPEGRLTDSISCWFRRSRAGHQVPSLVLSGVLGNHVFFCPY